jgi:uncharacterized protein YijF (DUF1287 family)
MELVSEDIKKAPQEYNIDTPDKNIDFRRVRNLNVFFRRHAISLTTDVNDIEEWQGGDIVIFKSSHIGIVSDKRTKHKIPYLIHNNGPYTQEENYLTKSRISGHYRFDAEKINQEILIPWK